MIIALYYFSAVLHIMGYNNDSFFQQVFQVARLVPYGRVTSYGAIARYLGAAGSARMVGWAMNQAHTLSAHTAEQAAQVIWLHWQSGQVLSALPEACRPQTAEQGYAIQAQLPGVAGRSVVGWKIAATSTNGQAHINVGGPLAGRLLSGQVFESGASVPSAGSSESSSARVTRTSSTRVRNEVPSAARWRCRLRRA